MYKYQTDFINTIKPMVIADMQSTGILASLTAAQAIFESGWGRSELATKAYNLFGMKGNYKGESYTTQTKEYANGQYYTANATFRKYPSWQESVNDHSEKFLTMQRYANLRGCTDYKLACRYVKEDGYSTAPDYAQKLIRTIDQYKLYDWDEEAAYGRKTEATEPMKKSSLATLTFDFGTKKSNPRTKPITKITPHIMDVITKNPVNVAKSNCNGTRDASANYYIAGGQICAGVSEDRRSWASSSSANDHSAITIEVSNCAGKPNYPVSDQDYKALIALCADICKRYGIIPHYDGTPNGTITVHRMFANKSCPGPYMMAKIESRQFENDIKAAMNGSAIQSQPASQQKVLYRVQVGAFSSKSNADSYCEKIKSLGENCIIAKVGNMYKIQVGAYAEKENALAKVEVLNGKGLSAIITTEQGEIVPSSRSNTGAGYQVRVNVEMLNVREKPDIASQIVTRAVRGDLFSVVEEKEACGYTWGRTASGDGWLALKYTTRI